MSDVMTRWNGLDTFLLALIVLGLWWVVTWWRKGGI